MRNLWKIMTSKFTVDIVLFNGACVRYFKMLLNMTRREFGVCHLTGREAEKCVVVFLENSYRLSLSFSHIIILILLESCHV